VINNSVEIGTSTPAYPLQCERNWCAASSGPLSRRQRSCGGRCPGNRRGQTHHPLPMERWASIIPIPNHEPGCDRENIAASRDPRWRQPQRWWRAPLSTADSPPVLELRRGWRKRGRTSEYIGRTHIKGDTPMNAAPHMYFGRFLWPEAIAHRAITEARSAHKGHSDYVDVRLIGGKPGALADCSPRERFRL